MADTRASESLSVFSGYVAALGEYEDGTVASVKCFPVLRVQHVRDVWQELAALREQRKADEAQTYEAWVKGYCAGVLAALTGFDDVVAALHPTSSNDQDREPEQIITKEEKRKKLKMPNVSFTQEDIVSAAEMPAGWYPIVLKSVDEGPGTKDASSTTYPCEFEVIDGHFKGARIQHWFTSKRRDLQIRFMQCFVKKPEPGKEYPLEGAIDQQLMGYVFYDTSFQKNALKDFKPIGK